MELFKLFGTIAINNAEANQSIDETADKAKGAGSEFDGLADKGEQAENKLSKFFSKVGKGAAVTGKIIASGLAVGATAMTGLTIKALNLGGELEQNMGGSEAVFKECAEGMQETAKNAFSNMGLSTSDFLATANKMGALFQGAGFDIQESADISTKAMQRAADVASIMGIDTNAAMEAIAGAAKGNFTMMDNLGVAMNDTTLQAYALSKGIEKSTSEMTNQEKIGLAMEMFLEKTEYAAGNYAKENETLAGSLGTAKAALTNFLDGSGDVESLVTAFSNAANVIVSNINKLLPQLVSGMTKLVEQLIPQLPSILEALLPGVITGAVQLVNGLVAALPMVVDALMAALPGLLSGIQQIFSAILTALPPILQSLIAGIVGILPQLLPLLINGVVGLVISLFSNVSTLLQPIIDALPGIITSVVDALMQNLPALIQGCVQLVIGVVQAIPQIILGLIEALPTIIVSIVQGLIASLPILIEGIISILGEVGIAVWEILGGFFTSLGEWLGGLWESIQTIFSPVIEWFGNLFGSIWESIVSVFSVVGEWVNTNIIQPVAQFFTGLWEGIVSAFHTVIDPWVEIIKRASTMVYDNVIKPILDFFTKLWDDIVGVFSVVSDWFTTNIAEPIKNIFTGIWDTLKNGASNAWEGIKSVFSAVTNWFKDVFSKAWQAVKNVFSTGGKIFDGIKDGIVKAFKTVVNAIIKGINKVIKLPFDGINSALKTIKGINILGVKPFGWIKTIGVPQIPELKEGGVLKKGQTGYLEGDGDEAVVPLEKNTGWIRNVAKHIHDFVIENNDKSKDVAGNALFNSNSSFEERQIAIMQMMDDKFDKVIGILSEYFPDFAEKMNRKIVLDDGTMVAKLTPKINRELGTILRRTERG